MKAKRPLLKIWWYETSNDGYPEYKEIGPFYSASIQGFGAKINQGWVSVEVQDQQLNFRKITIPNHATFSAMEW